MNLPELALGLNQASYGNMFVRDMRRLNTNLWLARFTKDKKGKSHVENIGLVYWRVPKEEWQREGFSLHGDAKRNRRRWGGNQAIALSVSNAEFINRDQWPVGLNRVTVELDDTDDNWRRAASMLVINGRLILPPEAFDEHDDNLRFPNYGNIVSEGS